MSYSLCRFWAYDESKKLVVKGTNPPAWQLALAGSMGMRFFFCIKCDSVLMFWFNSIAGGIAGVVGNPAEIIMVRMQGDFAKPPEKRLNYKNCFDGLYKVRGRLRSGAHNELFFWICV